MDSIYTYKWSPSPPPPSPPPPSPPPPHTHSQVSSPSHSGRGYFEQLSDPPADFELRPNDFDIDAELVPVDPNLSGSETGFFLRPRLELADEGER